MELPAKVSDQTKDAKNINGFGIGKSQNNATEYSAFTKLNLLLNNKNNSTLNFHQQVNIMNGVIIPTDIFRILVIACGPDSLLNLALTCKKYAYFIVSNQQIGDVFLNDEEHESKINAIRILKKLQSIEIAYYYPLARKSQYMPMIMQKYHDHLKLPIISLHKGVISAIKILERTPLNIHIINAQSPANYVEGVCRIKNDSIFYSTDYETWFNEIHISFFQDNNNLKHFNFNLFLISELGNILFIREDYNEKLFTAILNALIKHNFKDVFIFIKELCNLYELLQPVAFNQLMKVLQPILYDLGFNTRIPKENRPFSQLALNIKGLNTLNLLRQYIHDEIQSLDVSARRTQFSQINSDPLIKNNEYIYEIVYLLQTQPFNTKPTYIDTFCKLALEELHHHDLLNGELCYALFVKSLFTLLERCLARYAQQFNTREFINFRPLLRDFCKKIFKAIKKHSIKNCHLFLYRLVSDYNLNIEYITLFIDGAANNGFTNMVMLLDEMITLRPHKLTTNNHFKNLITKLVTERKINQAVWVNAFLHITQALTNNNNELTETLLNTLEINIFIYTADGLGLGNLINVYNGLVNLNRFALYNGYQFTLNELLMLIVTNNYDVVTEFLMMMELHASKIFCNNFSDEKQSNLYIDLLIQCCIKTTQIYGLEGFENLETVFDDIIQLSQQKKPHISNYALDISICIMTYGFKDFLLYSEQIKKRNIAASVDKTSSYSNASNLIQQGLFNHPRDNRQQQSKLFEIPQNKQLDRLISDLQTQYKNENHAIISKVYLDLSAQNYIRNTQEQQQMTARDTKPVKLLGPFSSLFEAINMEGTYIKLTQWFSQRTFIMSKTMTQAKLCFLLKIREYCINPEWYDLSTREHIIEKALQTTAVFFPTEQFAVKKEMVNANLTSLIDTITHSNQVKNAVLESNKMPKYRR